MKRQHGGGPPPGALLRKNPRRYSGVEASSGAPWPGHLPLEINSAITPFMSAPHVCRAGVKHLREGRGSIPGPLHSVDRRYAVNEMMITTKRFTPRPAIKSECRYCKNGLRYTCTSTICKLNVIAFPDLTPIKRIRKHCLDCVGSSDEVKRCAGIVLVPERHTCSLYEFRFGKNPSLKGKRGKGNPGSLEKYRETLYHGTF